MKVLITGGAGFIGYHLAQACLKKKWQLDLIDNFTRGVKDPDMQNLLKTSGIGFHSINLCNYESFKNIGCDYDLIFHLAAIVGVQNVAERPYDVLALNYAMLNNIITFGRKQKKLKRLVFTSTSEVYAGTLKYFGIKIPTPEDTPLTITDLQENRTSYMLSKIYGEAMCRYSGLPYTIVRPHNVYGPRMGMSHVIPELLKRSLCSKNKLKVYSVGHKRTFCYIDDAVEFLLRIAVSPDCNGVVLNLGAHGPEISIGELAEVILKVTGRKLEIEAMPETPGSPVRRRPDMALAENLTNFRARVDLHSGISKTYEWYLANVFSGHGVSAR